jgi:hypothetical protein
MTDSSAQAAIAGKGLETEFLTFRLKPASEWFRRLFRNDEP